MNTRRPGRSKVSTGVSPFVKMKSDSGRPTKPEFKYVVLSLSTCSVVWHAANATSSKSKMQFFLSIWSPSTSSTTYPHAVASASLHRPVVDRRDGNSAAPGAARGRQHAHGPASALGPGHPLPHCFAALKTRIDAPARTSGQAGGAAALRRSPSAALQSSNGIEPVICNRSVVPRASAISSRARISPWQTVGVIGMAAKRRRAKTGTVRSGLIAMHLAPT